MRFDRWQVTRRALFGYATTCTQAIEVRLTRIAIGFLFVAFAREIAILRLAIGIDFARFAGSFESGAIARIVTKASDAIVVRFANIAIAALAKFFAITALAIPVDRASGVVFDFASRRFGCA